MLISSAQNSRVKQLRALHDARARRKAGLFLLEGEHLIEEALASGAPIRFLLLDDEWEDKWALAARAAERQVPCFFASPKVMRQASTTESEVRAVGASRMLEVARSADCLPSEGLAVMLFGVQDPGNLGAVVRTAAAAGASAVTTAGPCADFFNPKTVRATAGAMFRVTLASAEQPEQFISECSARGYQTLAAVASEGKPYRDLDYKRPTLFVLGSEAHGIPDELLRACTERVTIGMADGVESLNVAVCAGILLFEARAQRHSRKGTLSP